MTEPPNFRIELLEGRAALEHVPCFARAQVEVFGQPPWNLKWYEGSVDDPKSALGFHTWAANNDSAYLGAYAGDQLAGFAVGLALNEDVIRTLELDQFGAAPGDYYFLVACVLPSFRRQGLYWLLIERRMELARAKKSPTLWVRTHVDSTTVTRYYREEHGFDEVARYTTVDYGFVTVPRVVLRKVVLAEAPV
ncbi:MAG: GNAT family N-acetyltransferase [Bdellovibrionales bacterium]|nr:GNAT family N-acetyltransferase [Bdellovibrionales bacterium]